MTEHEYRPKSVQGQITVLLALVREEAITAHVMTEAEKFSYNRSSPNNGIAPGIWIMPTDDPEGRKGRRVPDFLPRFNTKHSAKDVVLALDTAYRALYAANHLATRKTKP